MNRMSKWFLGLLQQRCTHDSNSVTADILEGDGDEMEVHWCRVCGAYRRNNSLVWTVPHASWWYSTPEVSQENEMDYKPTFDNWKKRIAELEAELTQANKLWENERNVGDVLEQTLSALRAENAQLRAGFNHLGETAGESCCRKVKADLRQEIEELKVDLALLRTKKINEKCIKCGSTEMIIYRYHQSSGDCLYAQRSDAGIYREHLHYHCRGCGYSWTGPTLDMEEKPA